MSMKKKAKDNDKIKQSFSHVLKNNAYMLGRVWHYVPKYIIWMVIEGLVWGIINSIGTLYQVKFFNAIDLGTPFWGHGSISSIIFMMAGFYIVAYAFDRWYWVVYEPILAKRLSFKLQRELFEKARQMELACYDDPKYYDDFVWAMDEADGRAIKVCKEVGKIINRLVAISTILSLLFTINIWVAIGILVFSVLYSVISIFNNRIWFELSKEQKPKYRKVSYFNRVFHLSDYAKELRTTDATEILLREHKENRRDITDTQIRFGKKIYLMNVIQTVLSLLMNYGVIVFMLFEFYRGNVLLGGFVASVNVIWKFRRLIYDLFDRFTKFPEHSLYIEKYLEFLRREPSVKSGEAEVSEFRSLEVKGLSFAYENIAPDTEIGKRIKEKGADAEKYKSQRSEVLKNISFTINKGEKIAFVGYNGAGKTTMIKLLMRLYDPQNGEILYNGKDIREYDLDEYRKHIGAVFQDFKLFGASIAENVMGGEFSPSDEKTVLEALDSADFSEKLSDLKDGINTPLTREFRDDGVNLSGGESQKVAIARVFARPYELIVMDEPSSALDPIAEYNLNHAILQKAADKAVIFISHRLSTTRMADKIYMFAGGEIIESGSHEELMAQGGKYAEMFELQAKKYRAAESA